MLPVFIRVRGGEVPGGASLAPKIGPLGMVRSASDSLPRPAPPVRVARGQRVQRHSQLQIFGGYVGYCWCCCGGSSLFARFRSPCDHRCRAPSDFGMPGFTVGVPSKYAAQAWGCTWRLRRGVARGRAKTQLVDLHKLGDG